MLQYLSACTADAAVWQSCICKCCQGLHVEPHVEPSPAEVMHSPLIETRLHDIELS